MSPRRRSVPLGPVFAMVLILIGLVVFLLVYGDLRNLRWVQGLVGVTMSLIIAVVLFSIVYSSIQVKNAAAWGGALGGGGAAIFYLLVLPQIWNFFFPPPVTRSVSGYVYFKRDDPQSSLRQVPGVIVELPTTGQKSSPTDSSGRFVIDGVSVEVTELQFHYGGRMVPANVNANNSYEVIDRPPNQVIHNKRVLSNVWKDDTYKCDLRPNQGYVRADAFTFEADLKKDGDELSQGATTLKLKLSIPNGLGDLTQPAIIEPTKDPVKSGYFSDDDHVERRSWGWQWDRIEPSQIKVRVGTCINQRQNDNRPRSTDLQTVYWYEVPRSEK